MCGHGETAPLASENNKILPIEHSILNHMELQMRLNEVGDFVIFFLICRLMKGEGKVFKHRTATIIATA